MSQGDSCTTPQRTRDTTTVTTALPSKEFGNFRGRFENKKVQAQKVAVSIVLHKINRQTDRQTDK